MNCYALLFFVLAVSNADQKVATPTRLESGGQVELAEVSRDGKRLFGAVKDADGYTLAAWDVPSNSKTLLAKGASLVYFSLARDGRSVLGCVGANATTLRRP